MQIFRLVFACSYGKIPHNDLFTASLSSIDVTTMPFLAKEHIPIPTKDVISWCYDNRHSFDQDKPVRYMPVSLIYSVH